MKTRQTARLLSAVAAIVATVTSAATASPTEIVVPGGQRLITESLTSSADGSVYVGSIVGQKIFRAAPQSSMAELWITPGVAIFGVFADDDSQTLWACSSTLGAPPAGATPVPAALHAYDLKTGADKGKWGVPTAGGFCNDIAVDAQGSVYITDTQNMEVDVLRQGGTALEVWAGNGSFGPGGGVLDGIAVIDDKLYVNALSTSKLFVATIGSDGKASAMSEVKLDRAIERPDGQRAWGGKLLVVEGGGQGRLSKVELSEGGLSGKVTTLGEGYPDGAVAVTVVGEMAYVLEGQLSTMRAPPGEAAKPYKATGVRVGSP